MKIKNLIAAPLGIAGASIGLGIVGTGMSSINSNMGNKALEAGQTSSKFISPAINITMGGFLVNQLKKLGKSNGKL